MRRKAELQCPIFCHQLGWYPNALLKLQVFHTVMSSFNNVICLRFREDTKRARFQKIDGGQRTDQSRQLIIRLPIFEFGVEP